MENVRAYGAGLAGANFDKNTFFKKPTVLFRCAALVFGLILWYSVSKGGWHKPSDAIHPVCLYGRSSSTCSFATAVGFFAVCGAVGLIVLDAKMDQISSIPTRRRAVLADLVVSAIFTGIFLIGFFTFWSKLSAFEVDEDDENQIKTNNAKFGILSALLSFLAWGGAAFFAWRRYEEGNQATHEPNYDEQFGQVSSDVQDGYGYGGDSTGIGHVGGPTPPQSSYQSGAPPQTMQQPPANPYTQSEGYGY
ncbi:hypothetical protein CAEBREN_25380 [Caenorhabditis brenneri]|uniref:Synaptogyrin n=1 Tax=Caenorhabditis brenneri TaxID=135651 RepID=G0N4Z1_CAEBE|nr:hypothetical protein CAEBREN_25380 [Caenorhabditis brenneri]